MTNHRRCTCVAWDCADDERCDFCINEEEAMLAAIVWGVMGQGD